MAMHTAPRGTLTETTANGTWWWVTPSIILGLVALIRRPPTLEARAAALAGIFIGLVTATITAGVPLELLRVAASS